MRSNNSEIRCLEQGSDSTETLAIRFRAGSQISDQIVEQTRKIVDDVRNRGDAALVEYSSKFDGVNVERENLRVSEDEISKSCNQIDSKIIETLASAKKRVEKVQKEILRSLSSVGLKEEGCDIKYKPKAIESVGCYVPGGRAAYPSSLIMSVVPSMVANVPRTTVCTPPTKDQNAFTLTLAAAQICGVKEVYRVGGAQAISALAFGTETILRVAKIVGAGGPHVTASKITVSDRVAIDLPAGPTELLIFADESADARTLAFDLVAQAEHGTDSLCGLVSTSSSIINGVKTALPEALKMTSRGSLAEKSLAERGFLLKVNDEMEAVSFINRFAPEHLQICTFDPHKIEPQIKSAGLILLGSDTPTAATDYIVGTNHVLPTMGYASTISGLSVLSFVKITGVVKCTDEWLRNKGAALKILAEAESLNGHSNSVYARLGE